MTSIPPGARAHPLSPRRRWVRVLLVIVGLVVLHDIDPDYVSTLGTWLGILAVLAPEIFLRGGDEPPGTVGVLV